MRFTVVTMITLAAAQSTNQKTITALEGVNRINQIVKNYDVWIGQYASQYKKLNKLSRAVERMRRYFTWWVKGNKRGCQPGPVESIELDGLDGLLERQLPANAPMLKVITYQTQIQRLHRLFFVNCTRKVNRKLGGIIAKLTRDLTQALNTGKKIY